MSYPIATFKSSKEQETSMETREISTKSESRTELVELKKELGLWNGVGIIIGSMIGSGIFVSPGSVVKHTGSMGMALIVWVLSGLMGMTGALCYAELGTMIPKNGGEYTYILETFGPIPAFINLWTSVVLAGPASRAIGALTFATYVLQPIFVCGSPPFWAVRLVALALIWFVGYINYAGVKMGSRLQDSLTLLKLLALVVIVVLGGIHLARGNIENYLHPMEGTITNPASIATAFYSTTFAYSGWDNLNYMTEELKNPNKNLPRAIIISLITVTAVYILTNMAYFAVLTPSEILSSSAVAVTFGNRMLGVIAWIISIFVACSVFGNINGATMTFSRVIYAGAREGHLPKCLCLIHVHNNTPATAIVGSLIAPSIIVFAKDIGTILTYMSFGANLMNLICILAFFWLRYKEPERPRPIKVWLGIPIIYLLLNIFVTVFPVVEKPVEIATSVAAFIIGLLVYYLAIHRQNQIIGNLMDKLYYLCQVIFLCVEDEKNE